MNKKITLTRYSTQVHQSRGYSKIFNTMWSLVLLLLVFMAGCEKDDFTAEVTGLCPVVVSTDPMDKAVDVALNKVISATFNTAMKASTIDNTTFILKQGSVLISGKVAPATNGATFTFTPDIALSPFTLYTGTITTGATDTLKTAMVSDYVWTFTTIPQVTVSSNPSAGGTAAGGGAFAQGSVVTVGATPATGYTFAYWTNNGTLVSTSASYQFIMAGNRTLVANFTPVVVGNFAVVLTSNPVAGGTTNGAGSYSSGSSVTVTAFPHTGYAFVNWTENGVVASSSPGYTFTLNANRSLVANYSIIPASQFAVILSSSPPAGGTTSGSGSFIAGSSVAVTASSNTGYMFTNWTDNGNIVSTSSGYTFALNANRTLVANFAINTYSLNVTATNGTVVRNPDQLTYNHGSTVQLTATPNTGYTFTSWGGDATGTANPLAVTMNGNKNIIANFTAIPPSNFTLTVTATNGTVAKNPNQATYNSGSAVQLTATPNSGYTFTSWSGDAAGTTNPLTVIMNANKNISANFTAIAPPAAPLFSSIFGAFGGSAGITNQGINTVINNGSIGTTAASTLITGFHDNTGDKYTETPLNVGDVKGRIYTDAPPPVIFGPGGPFGGTAATKAIATAGLAAANTFYISISPANRPGTVLASSELGGIAPLAPGTYRSPSGPLLITGGNLTLDAQGDPNAVWVFQAPTSLTVGLAGPSGAKSIILVNGALAQNVYWYVGSAATINGAGGGIMVGTIISSAGVTFSTAGNATQTVLNGRALSLVASVTMVNTTINVPQ